MVHFQEKGFSLIQILHPQMALGAWDDLDQYKLHQILGEPSDRPFNVMNPPQTPSFLALNREIDKVRNSPFIMSQILTCRVCLSAGSSTAISG